MEAETNKVPRRPTGKNSVDAIEYITVAAKFFAAECGEVMPEKTKAFLDWLKADNDKRMAKRK